VDLRPTVIFADFFPWVKKTGVGLKGALRFAPDRLAGAESAPAQRLPVRAGWRIRRCRASRWFRSDVAGIKCPEPVLRAPPHGQALGRAGTV